MQKPVSAETIVCAAAKSTENQREFTRVFFRSRTVPATARLLKDGCFGSHSTEGSITSLLDMKVMESF